MNKLTKRHYNRKLLVFGIMMFISIALISTGFAAFILSTNAKSESNGNIEVGQLDSNTMKIEDVVLSNPSFRFDAKSTDTGGRIRGKQGDEEVLSVTITGTVTNASYLKLLTVKLAVTDNIKAAADKGYIILPSEVDNETQVNDLTTIAGDKKTFQYTITFMWGEVFDKDGTPDTDETDNVNPCEFYDILDVNGKYLVDDEKMIEDMTEFRALMYGLDQAAADFDVNQDAAADATKFTIEFNAYVN